jgi:hypothetical protein
MPNYHGDALFGKGVLSVSSSHLRTIYRDSPAHYWCDSPYNPQRDPEEDDTAALALGRAAHWMLCRQPDFRGQFIERPGKWKDYKTKDAREWRDGLIAAGKTPLTPAEVKRVRGMAIALGRSQLFADGILDGFIELTLVWRDPITGIWLKARPDIVLNKRGDFCDLKTTRSVQWYAMQASIDDYAYDMQAAFVMLVAQQLGLPIQSFSFVFIESSEPHCIGAVMLKDLDLETADELNRAALTRLAMHYEAWTKDNEYQWPGPVNDREIRHIELTKRAHDRRLSKLKFGMELATESA